MKLRKLEHLLLDAKKYAALEHASFSNICRTGNSSVTFEDGRPVLENNVTEFIRERVRLHHESWIISPLEEALKMIDEELSS